MDQPSETEDIDMLDDRDLDVMTVLGEHLINSILAAEPRAIIEEILNREAPVWYQNTVEGISCLHAAAYMQDTELVKILLERGAIWNAVDYFQNTAGDIALSFNDTETYLVIRDAGIRSELVLALLGSQAMEQSNKSILQQIDSTGAGSTDAFLSSTLRFATDEHGQEVCFLTVDDGEEVGVMMGWEQGIMERTVKQLCEAHEQGNELKVLNIGFGLGIIDTLFQNLPNRPVKHVIIEPHPDVLKHMRNRGWYEKEGVEVIEAKWQDVILSHKDLLGGFDVVYTDTFSEDYAQLQEFFEHLPRLLTGRGSRFSFFNGLGATNPLFYDVYTRIAEVRLGNVGLDVNWIDVDVTGNRDERWGESREYFSLPTYRLPVARLSEESQTRER